MKTILVSGASGVVGYGILRSLRKSGRPFKLVGTSIYNDSAAQAFCDVFEQAPPTAAAGYVDWLRQVIASHHVDLLIPGIEVDVYSWAESRGELEKSGARVLLNNPELIALCRDKWLFFQRLKASGLQCVIDTSLDSDFEVLASRFGLPFLLKPRVGYASKGIVTVDSLATFAKHQSQVGLVLMAQPVVGSDQEEFTTSAFCDGQGGLYARMTLRRKLSPHGFTDRAEVADLEDLEQTLAGLCGLLRPLGPTNFQFRRHLGALKLLEINPRISSATSIRTAFGYNECLMAVEYYLAGTVPGQPMIREGRAVRYMEDLIFYL